MRLRIGVIGCGLIAQTMHLPHLLELKDAFELAAIADLSPSTLQKVGDRFGVRDRYTDWRELVSSEVDAVMVLTSGSHAPAAIAAARAGKHVFVEKPMCITLREAAAMQSAATDAGVTMMVGYNRCYDPAYLYARDLVHQMKELRLVQITTLEAPIPPYVKHLALERGANDVPQPVVDELLAQRSTLVREALGDVPPLAEKVYMDVMLDTLVHELSAMRGVMGDPLEVRTADFWRNGDGVTISFRYPNEVECILTWIWLPTLRSYLMEFGFYGDDSRVELKFPSPFLKNTPTPVIAEGQEGEVSWRKEVQVNYETSFKEELRHFHHCVSTGEPPRTSVAEATKDIAIFLAAIRAFVEHKPQQVVFP